jgi:hypothetical protein
VCLNFAKLSFLIFKLFKRDYEKNYVNENVFKIPVK